MSGVDFGDNRARGLPRAGGADPFLYVASDGLVAEPFALVADGPFRYFMDYNENAFRVSANGGSPAFLGSGNNGGVFGNSFGITTDSTNVYFGGNRVLLRGDKMVTDGGAPIATSIVLPDGLVYDPSTTMVYWSNWG